MTRFASLAALFVLAALSISCAGKRTQVVLILEADPMVTARTQTVQLAVFGGARTAGSSDLPNEAQMSIPIPAAGKWPLEVVLLPRGGDTTRLYRVVAEARDAQGSTVSELRVISGYVEGQTLFLRLRFFDRCIGTTCADPGQTCIAPNQCASARVDESTLPKTRTGDDGSVAAVDGGNDLGADDQGPLPTVDGGPDARTDAGSDSGRVDSGSDAGPPPGCMGPADCDDRVACTVDACVGGECSHTPNVALCTAGTATRCDPVEGCQYRVCNATTCAAGPCETAVCMNGVCNRTALCDAGEICCNNACAAPGCNDGNPCTDDSCEATGCLNAPNNAPCDDRVFCNGTDMCSNRSCSVHTNMRCPGQSMCNEPRMECTGCVTSADCPMPSSQVGACNFTDVCSTSGLRGRTTTTYTCAVGGVCIPQMTTAEESCTRPSTNGLFCDPPTFMDGPCVPAQMCSTLGTAQRTVMQPICANGTCSGVSQSMTSTSCTATPTGSCADAGPACQPYENCLLPGDEDCNGFADCSDGLCSFGTACEGMQDGGVFCIPQAIEICNNGLDDNCNFMVDCADSQCFASPLCGGIRDGGRGVVFDGGVD